MTKPRNVKGMNGGGNRKVRGRTSITDTNPGAQIIESLPPTLEHETSRPVGTGSGKHRGDRRDMSPLYTGSRKHSARGNTPRADVKTRKR